MVPLISARAQRVAALAAFAVAAIFITQEICFHLAADPESTDELLKVGVPPLNLLRARLMFCLFFFTLVVKAGLFARLRNFPALVGLIVAAIGCTVELAYRALELEGLFARWLPAYLQAHDEVARQLARGRLDLYFDMVVVAYRIIGVTAPMTSLCFGLATFRGATRLERALGILFLVNCARQSIRYIVPLFPALAEVPGTVFIFVMAPVYIVAGLWLWRLSPPQTAARL